MNVRELLQRSHDLLDLSNGVITEAVCQYCRSRGYDGNGLIHQDDCVIATLRRELERMRMQVPTIGRIVHYRFPESEGGMERPAIIVRTWGSVGESAVQLQVFTDSDAEGRYNDQKAPLTWKTSVVQGNEPGQYHFHEDCQA